MASTGVIGEPLPAHKITAVLAGLVEQGAAGNWRAAADAIMTTDTYPKAATATATIDGVKVTINSDDPAYFGGYLQENYAQTSQALNLTRAELAEIAANSFKGAFLSAAEKTAYLARIDAYMERHRRPRT